LHDGGIAARRREEIALDAQQTKAGLLIVGKLSDAGVRRADDGASHAATAQTVSTPLALRLIWINAPTLRLLGDPAASGNQFGLGGSVVQTIEGGRGAFVAEFIGTSFFSPPQALPSVEGQWLVDGSLAFGFGFLPATGHEERRLAIPNDHGGA